MNKKAHFISLQKSTLLATLIFCLSFCTLYGSSNQCTEIQTKITFHPVLVKGESLIVAAPCIPVAGFKTNSGLSAHSFRDKEIVELIHFPSYYNSIFSSNAGQHFHQGEYSLRLHLVFRVLRI